MARDSEFQRERKKKQLRQSMVTNDKVRSAPVSWAEDHRRTVNVAGKVEMTVVVFDSHMVVACFGFVMFVLLGYSRMRVS